MGTEHPPLSAEPLPRAPVLTGQGARERAMLGSHRAGRAHRPLAWAGGRAQRQNAGSADAAPAKVLPRRSRGGTAHQRWGGTGRGLSEGHEALPPQTRLDLY